MKIFHKYYVSHFRQLHDDWCWLLLLCLSTVTISSFHFKFEIFQFQTNEILSVFQSFNLEVQQMQYFILSYLKYLDNATL